MQDTMQPIHDVVAVIMLDIFQISLKSIIYKVMKVVHGYWSITVTGHVYAARWPVLLTHVGLFS